MRFFLWVVVIWQPLPFGIWRWSFPWKSYRPAALWLGTGPWWDQLERSATSIGANLYEAQYAHSKADFIAKLQIALKECAESEYWLELLLESGYCSDREVLERCVEVKKLLVSSLNTAKRNQA